jgi:Ca-activated chloride channel homolog
MAANETLGRNAGPLPGAKEHRMSVRTSLVAVAVFTLSFAGLPNLAPAQILVPNESATVRVRPPVHPPIHPIPRPFVSSYKIQSVDLQATVHDQAAKIRMSQVFQNTGSVPVEGQFVFPIPDGAAVSDLTLLYDGKELPGRLLGKDEARRIYEEIVRRQRDPALLEYLGEGMFQTSVFPIPPHSDRTVEIRYTQLLKKTGGLVDLLLPLGTLKHANHAIDRLTVSLRLETADPLKTLYSPTHSVTFERPDEHHATGKLTLNNVTSPDDLRVLYSTHAGAVGMNLISYRSNDKEDGYFLLFASPELKASPATALPKTAVIVIDRSGSMSGQKIEQARQAVKFFLNQLKPGDTFNVIAYDSEVEAFRPELQRVTSDTIKAAIGFADGINAGGGTNIDGALQTALGMLKDNKRPSYVLFLTDGMPTVGEQNEVKIVTHAKDADKVNARIFNLGIGFDVNSRLLDRLSRELNGQSVYVKPNENIETHVSTLAKSIGSPVLANVDVKFEFDRPNATSAPPISRTYPRKLTDLFAGEQLVWVGRYREPGSVKLTLSGDLGGKPQTYTLTAELASHSIPNANAFVEKVWAARRIGELIDQIDLNGNNKELTDELVQLSLKYGILTPYTSFLADDRVDLGRVTHLRSRASESLQQLQTTDGISGFEQRDLKLQLKGAQGAPSPQSSSGGFGGGGMGGGGYLGPANPRKWPARGTIVGMDSPAAFDKDNSGAPVKQSVQTVADKTFYWKNNQWRDADLTAENEKNPTRVQQFSDAYFALAARDNGRFAKYLALDGPILLQLADKTYLIEPAVAN